ncbi:MAG: flagellar basal body-associated FliL family protein [Desulfobacteraceae bacterium]|nr:flagellar basal body-associated FliL family protein [Desulfobacteraceae bacterium]
MTENLLDDMEEEMEDESLGEASLDEAPLDEATSDGQSKDGVESQESSGKKSFAEGLGGLKKLLGAKKKLVLISGIILFFVVILGVVGSLFFGGSPEDSNVSNDISVTQAARVSGGSVKTDIITTIVFENIIELEPFERIRLKSNSVMGLVSLDLSMELIDLSYKEQVVSMQEKIRKIIIGQVREMRWLELRNPEGKIHLKYELLKKFNALFPKVMVRDIYFTNLIMQR